MRIVALLRHGERNAGQIAAEFSISRPAVSRHLRVLTDAGVLRVRRQAQQRRYALDPATLQRIDEWLSPYRPFWEQRLDALDTEIRRGKRDTRRGAGVAPHQRKGA